MGRRNDDEVNTNTFECPNCGQRVYTEDLVCPKCGLHFYETGYLSHEVDEPTRVSKGLTLHAILAGLITSVVINFLGNWIASRIWSPQSIEPTGLLVLFLCAPAGALVGGYLAARLLESDEIHSALAYGLAVSVLSLGAAYLLQAYWRDITIQSVHALILASWAAALLVGPFGALLAKLSMRETASVPVNVSEMRLYLDLLAYVRHDINIAEQCIAYERKHAPSASRKQLIANAITRLEHEKS